MSRAGDQGWIIVGDQRPLAYDPAATVIGKDQAGNPGGTIPPGRDLTILLNTVY